VTCGQAVIDQQLHYRRDNRLFRNFKRGIVTSSAETTRTIDDSEWSDRDAGQRFMQNLLAALPNRNEIDQLVLTAPISAFEDYLIWLSALVTDITPDKVRILDESTAAALGYAVTEPGAVVLVFDFGGGTLDLSLVQLPESKEKTGGFLQRLRRSTANQHTARVIAKAGRVIGGSDIDQWLLADVLRRIGLSSLALGKDYAALLTQCEQVKIALSSAEQVPLVFTINDQAYDLIISRDELDAILESNGFFSALRHIVDKVMYVARQQSIFKEDIRYVLMVGGVSLMPSVQRLLRGYFTDMAVRADKPFTAIAEGALQLSAGFGLEDYLIHGYGIRHLDPQTHQHQYDEIIPMGSHYPSATAVEVKLGAAHADQKAVELIIGEIDSDAVSMVEVVYENGQAVFVAQADRSRQQIVPLNAEQAAAALARLLPPGQLGEDRLNVAFSIDDRRQLIATVSDLKTNKTLLNNVVIATLR
jgi:molecular chaperone DnaK (HSP70)